jgi:hypothetical protein
MVSNMLPTWQHVQNMLDKMLHRGNCGKWLVLKQNKKRQQMLTVGGMELSTCLSRTTKWFDGWWNKNYNIASTCTSMTSCMNRQLAACPPSPPIFKVVGTVPLAATSLAPARMENTLQHVRAFVDQTHDQLWRWGVRGRSGQQINPLRRFIPV